MLLGMEVGLGPDYTVLDGDPTSPKKGHSLQFLAHVCCGQMAGWIKMAFGTQIGLGPSSILLEGDTAPPKKGAQQKGTAAPHFLTDVYCGQTAVCIRIPLGTDVGLGPGDIVLDGTQLPPMERDTTASTFRPMSIVAKRSPISATAELL